MSNACNSDKTLSVALAVSAALWGLYWLPLRTIESAGLSGAWSVVFFNACPLLVLCPLLLFNFRKLKNLFWPTVLAAVMIGLAFTLYANGLVETTVARATLLYYLTPVWSTILGVVWLSERLTKARIVAICVAFIGLILLLSGGGATQAPLNIGDLYSFLSGICWAAGIAALNRWASIPIVPLTTFVFLFTTMMSAALATLFYSDPVPLLAEIRIAFPTAAFWSIVILLPCFFIIFRVSQFLFPGRVGILTMSEVIVAIVSAAVLLPEEVLLPVQWLGAVAIIFAGIVEVVFGFNKDRPGNAISGNPDQQ